MSRTKKNFIDFLNKYNYKLNPNEKIINKILKAQNKYKIEIGEYYCPCKREKIKQNICPCKDVHKEIKKNGKCTCNLFLKN